MHIAQFDNFNFMIHRKATKYDRNRLLKPINSNLHSSVRFPVQCRPEDIQEDTDHVVGSCHGAGTLFGMAREKANGS